MIRKFGVRNFACFKEGIEIDFTLSGKVPEEVSHGRPCTTVLGVKGANGSGKTNVLKAIAFLNDFCYGSANTDKSADINLKSYRGNPEPTEFFIDFEFDGVGYSYELKVDSRRVYEEVIHKQVGSRRKIILKREEDSISQAADDLREIETIQLRSNASVVSMVEKYKFKSDMDDLRKIYLFFLRMITNVSHIGYMDYHQPIPKISERYLENEELFDFVKRIIVTADSGIKDVVIDVRQDEDGNDIHLPYFIHGHEDGDFRLSFFEESSGTQALYKKMFHYWLVLDTGGFLALDEFDVHLHALVLPKVLDLFLDPEINRYNAQFIFTAHNTEIIDTLGKYRTILVNKENNESYCYRLDEIPGSMIRNDRPIMPIYLKGKIGGVPFCD